MRILDLFCCAGGASMGYLRAGASFVVGVDIRRHVHYPFQLHKGDAISLLEWLLEDPVNNQFDGYKNGKTGWYSLSDFDAIHASPPCQPFSDLTIGTNQHLDYVNLVPRVRQLLDMTGKPYIIENVEGAPLREDIKLCGEMFGLRVIRHRIFEISGFKVPQPEHIPHRGTVQGYKNGKFKEGYYFPVHGRGGGKGTVKEWQDAMGIHWTKARVELAEAIPPAYTEYIGKYLLDHLEKTA